MMSNIIFAAFALGFGLGVIATVALGIVCFKVLPLWLVTDVEEPKSAAINEDGASNLIRPGL